MTSTAHTYTRYVLATAFFAMCFMLTPRAWVEDRDASGEMIPVHMLDGPGGGECIWCAPLIPVKCVPETDARPGEDDAAPALDRLPIHPDEAPADLDALPCSAPDVADDGDGPTA